MAGKRQTTFSKRDLNVHTYADGHVEFRDYINLAEYSIRSLTAFALTDVGKYICNNVRVLLQQERPEMTGKAKKRIFNAYQYWNRKWENDLVVGIKNLSKSPSKYGSGFHSSGERNYDAWYSVGYEIGMQGRVKMPRKAFLQNFVYQNVDMIRRIEAQYLTAINQDNDALEAAISSYEANLNDDDGSLTE